MVFPDYINFTWSPLALPCPSGTDFSAATRNDIDKSGGLIEYSFDKINP